jgi:hypothetical protein
MSLSTEAILGILLVKAILGMLRIRKTMSRTNHVVFLVR